MHESVSAEPAYRLLNTFYNADEDRVTDRKLREYIDRSPAARGHWMAFMARTVAVLRANGRHHRADWVKMKALGHITEHAQYFEQKVARTTYPGESNEHIGAQIRKVQSESTPSDNLFRGQNWQPVS